MEPLHTQTCPPCEALNSERVLSARFVDGVLEKLAVHEPLIADGTLDQLVQGCADPYPLDSYGAVCCLAGCSPIMAGLLSGRTGVREDYRLHEHTQAVLNGLESDYLSDFPDSRERVMLRTALLLQDIGKSLCIGHCGDRRRQAPYNVAVIENLLSSVSGQTLSTSERDAIRLLLSHDILGEALKGYKGVGEAEAQARITAIEQSFPQPYRSRCRDFMRAVYLSDSTAYTSFRSYIDSETGMRTPCLPALNETYPVFALVLDGRVSFADPATDRLLGRLTTQSQLPLS